MLKYIATTTAVSNNRSELEAPQEGARLLATHLRSDEVVCVWEVKVKGKAPKATAPKVETPAAEAPQPTADKPKKKGKKNKKNKG